MTIPYGNYTVLNLKTAANESDESLMNGLISAGVSFHIETDFKRQAGNLHLLPFNVIKITNDDELLCYREAVNQLFESNERRTCDFQLDKEKF